MTLGLQIQMLQAEQNTQIIEFRQSQVDVFNEAGTERIARVDASQFTMPISIVKTLNSGYYVIAIDGEARAVRKRSVKTDRIYKMTSNCSNQLSGNKAGASRGLGNGEC